MSDEPSSTADWTLSLHALEAMARRDFTVDEVMRAVLDPELSYPQSHYGDDREMRVRGAVAVPVLVGARLILTVLWHRTEQWSDVECWTRSRALIHA